MIPARGTDPGRSEPNLLAQQLGKLNDKLDTILAALQTGVTVAAEVGLTDEAVADVAKAVVDEEQQRLET